MAKQIDLLFGVKGGGAISGASGVEIKKAIDSIVSELNKLCSEYSQYIFDSWDIHVDD